ncbi:MucBP domain-containing protein [Ligilactobacillus faecis]|uniref:MucBP domain-containing protein n=1 Tax=Ligilactobacillus faecis TaxID=762833 RepID=UPI00246969F6|nr:MucBP domain-containing protein [Ligilactobacillus faecis]WGN88763.1 MucBP domain-containing protein [Ligilactobacillus faecis]
MVLKKITTTIVVEFITPLGQQILEPQTLLKPIGERYQVKIPTVIGYVLVGHQGDLSGVADTKKIVRLIYKELGELVIRKGLAGNYTLVEPFQNSSDALKIKKIKLPKLEEKEAYYFVEEKAGKQVLGARVADTNNFIPSDPTKKVYLFCLTPAQYKKLNGDWGVPEIQLGEEVIIKPIFNEDSRSI